MCWSWCHTRWRALSALLVVLCGGRRGYTEKHGVNEVSRCHVGNERHANANTYTTFGSGHAKMLVGGLVCSSQKVYCVNGKAGTAPVILFMAKFNVPSAFNKANPFGMVPVNWLVFNHSALKAVSSLTPFGMVPTRLFPYKFRFVNHDANGDQSSRTRPTRLFPYKFLPTPVYCEAQLNKASAKHSYIC